MRVLPFLLPVFTSDGLINRRLAHALGTAMWMYDLTGGLRIGKLHRRISKDAAIAHMPTLQRVAPRLGVHLLRRARRRRPPHAHRRAHRRRARSRGRERRDRRRASTRTQPARVHGVRVVADGDEIVVRARTVVNATGVWADDVRALDEGVAPDSIRPAKGVHITVPWAKVRNDIAAVIPVRKDRRSVFVVPWGDFTYIGTTDTDYDGPTRQPAVHARRCRVPAPRAINGVVTTPISESDVLGTWAGLRPLVKRAGSERTADLSRRHSVISSPSGVVTVTGGKLTTYRRMAADAIDAVDARARRERARSGTARLPLAGAAELGPRRALGPPRGPLRQQRHGREGASNRSGRSSRADRARARPTRRPRSSTRRARRWRARSTTY